MENVEQVTALSRKRNKILYGFFAVSLLILIFRLAYIQLVCHEEFQEAAISQYETPVYGLDTRGAILDRNLMPLTGGVKEYYYIISRTLASEKMESLEKIMEDLAASQLAKKSSSYLVYRTQSFDRDASQRLKEDYKAYVFQTEARYKDDQLACHLIGYINQDQKIGASGLELLMENKLAAKANVLTLWADARGAILLGSPPHIKGSEASPMEDSSVVTTIDRRLQHVSQTALAGSSESGAVIVMDCQSGEILAWASAPTFNPNNIADYLEEEGDCLLDKVCQGAYPPGSVFKIITAAAALEEGVCTANTKFTCHGQVEIEGVVLPCGAAPEGGHGELDMGQAMACSCNCYFAQLGQAVGQDQIVRMARKMGLGQDTLDDYPQEAEGNVPSEEEIGPWDICNLSIGQGQLLATPLQIAQMTSIIASGGLLIEPKIIASSSSSSLSGAQKSGLIVGKRIISKETAENIEKMLAKVMTDGTASGRGQWQSPVYGKTGTAETGIDGKDTDCWFTGYLKEGEKTYVITVMVEDGASGSASALPVFREIVSFIENRKDTL